MSDTKLMPAQVITEYPVSYHLSRDEWNLVQATRICKEKQRFSKLLVEIEDGSIKVRRVTLEKFDILKY